MIKYFGWSTVMPSIVSLGGIVLRCVAPGYEIRGGIHATGATTRATTSPVASSFCSLVLTNIPCAGLPEFGNNVVAVTIEIDLRLVMRRPYGEAGTWLEFGSGSYRHVLDHSRPIGK